MPDATSEDPQTAVRRKPWRARLRMLWKGCVRLVCATVIVLGAYLLLALVGLIPVNTGFVNGDESDADNVKIFVRSSGVHADIIVPVESSVVHWRDYFPDSDFQGKTSGFKHVAFGWGDRGFYLETPTWDDLRVSTAAKAILLPSESVMHVSMTRPRESKDCRSVTIDRKQYRRLVDYIRRSFVLEEVAEPDPSDLSSPASQTASHSDNHGEESTTQTMRPVAVDAKFSYHAYDRFYQATGNYHAFHTCNCWVGRGLQTAGVRTAWFTPLPRAVFVHWPE